MYKEHSTKLNMSMDIYDVYESGTVQQETHMI